MAEETNTEVEEQEEEKSIWELLNLEEPEEEYEDEQEEQDEKIAQESKLEKKLSAKMDNMQKKFENTMLRERISKFQDTADDLEKDLFKTIASDVKNLEDFDKAQHLVHERALMLQKEADKYRAQMEEQAANQAANAWGTGPVGTPQKREKNDSEEMAKKIAAGDTHAAFAALMSDDSLMTGKF
jgi:hypothetical protein